MALSTQSNDKHLVAGIILAGGQSRRFAYRDKSWAVWENQPLIEAIIHKATPQVAVLGISSNCPSTELAKFESFHLPILKDKEYPQQGPLSGVLRGLQWAKQLGLEWLVSFPIDTPNFVDNLVERLMQRVLSTHCRRVIACDTEHEQNVLGIWSIELIEVIRLGLSQGHNKVNLCLQDEPYETVLFEQPFLNINTPSLLQQRSQQESVVQCQKMKEKNKAPFSE